MTNVTRMAIVGIALAFTLALGAAPASAAFPGKPGPVVYVKTFVEELPPDGELEPNSGLYVDPPGRRRRPRQLTSNRTDGEPSYSPDGRRIVFFSVGGEGPGIYVIDRDGSGKAKVTDGGSAPAFFPSGRAIVFSRSEGGDSHIWSVRLDGTGLRQLTFGPYDDYDPVVSSDGRRIAFSSDRDPDGRRDRSDIFSMRPNGAGIRVTIDGPRSEFEPDWAPNGRRIAYVLGTGPRSNVLVARADGRRKRVLNPCRRARQGIRCPSYSSPAFSPSGRQVVFRSGGSRTSAIDVVDARRRGTGRSVDSGGTEEEGFGSYVSEPSWGVRPR